MPVSLGDVADTIRKIDLSSLGEALSCDVSVFEQASNLEEFNVSGCTEIKGELPRNLIKLIGEGKAKFDGCEGPFTLPPTLGATADSIVKVDLSSLGKALRGDVSVFSEATKMESFNVSGCTGIKGELPVHLLKVILDGKAKFKGCSKGAFTLPTSLGDAASTICTGLLLGGTRSAAATTTVVNAIFRSSMPELTR